ncbi:hypothetical protein HYU12_02060 [Candidatus Woesearchaeota archaeon]|nr:hypothetical protein [Candidatus Woesearchaeota archaeon]
MPAFEKRFVAAKELRNDYSALKSLESVIGKPVSVEIRGWEWEDYPVWNSPTLRTESVILEGIIGQDVGNGIVITHIIGYNPGNGHDVMYATNAVDEVVLQLSGWSNAPIWENPYPSFFCDGPERRGGMSLEDYRRRNPLDAQSGVLEHDIKRPEGEAANRFLQLGIVESLRVGYLASHEVRVLLRVPL